MNIEQAWMEIEANSEYKPATISRDEYTKAMLMVYDAVKKQMPKKDITSRRLFKEKILRLLGFIPVYTVNPNDLKYREKCLNELADELNHNWCLFSESDDKEYRELADSCHDLLTIVNDMKDKND